LVNGKNKESLMLTFGQCLRGLLEREGVTQEQFADKLGVTQPAVNYYLRLVDPPKRRTLIRFAAALGVSIEELLGGKAGVVYGGQAARAGAVVAEAGGGVGEWLEEVRLVWRRDAGARARIELAVRTLWGAARAEEVLRWLKEEEGRR